MDEEVKRILEKNLEVSEKSLHILRELHRALIWSRVLSAAKWIIIIALIIVGFITIRPYIEYWSNVVNSTSENIQKFNEFFK